MEYDYSSIYEMEQAQALRDIAWQLERARLNSPQYRTHSPEIIEVYKDLSPFQLALLEYDHTHIIPWRIAKHFTSKSIWEKVGWKL